MVRESASREDMMSLSSIAIPRETRVPGRLSLFGAAVVLGALGGIYWNRGAAGDAYYGFLQVFLDPRAQIAGLGIGIALAFLAGFVHVVQICYLPAALSALPLAQVARDRREWLRIAAVLTVAMVAVTALWGAIVAGGGGALAGSITPRNMSSVLKPTMVVVGGLMLVIALGELGLVRRILPVIHPAAPVAPTGAPRSWAPPWPRPSGLSARCRRTWGCSCTSPRSAVWATAAWRSARTGWVWPRRSRLAVSPCSRRPALPVSSPGCRPDTTPSTSSRASSWRSLGLRSWPSSGSATPCRPRSEAAARWSGPATGRVPDHRTRNSSIGTKCSARRPMARDRLTRPGPGSAGRRSRRSSAAVAAISLGCRLVTLAPIACPSEAIELFMNRTDGVQAGAPGSWTAPGAVEAPSSDIA